MTTEKLFDCVIIAIDAQKRKKVRFANNLANRLETLKRNNIHVLAHYQLERKMTKLDAVKYLKQVHDEVDDEELINITEMKLSKIKVTTQDIFNAILSRKSSVEENHSLV